MENINIKKSTIAVSPLPSTAENPPNLRDPAWVTLDYGALGTAAHVFEAFKDAYAWDGNGFWGTPE